VKKKQLLKEAFFASLLVLTIDLLISFFPFKFELLRPIKQGLNDFDIYDLRYSGNDSFNNQKDTNITILSIGNTRTEIADQIRTVDSFKPKIIGIDAGFWEKRNPEEDIDLVGAISHAGKIVVLSRYILEKSPKKDMIGKSFFTDSIANVKDGLWNFLEGAEEVNRHFIPFISVNGSKYPAFATSVLEQACPDRYNELINRKRDIETINYSGNAEYFNLITLEKYKQYKMAGELKDLFSNKIVLIGFINDKEPFLLEDMHFTPLNKKYAGKSFPDMYGVVIQANILEMMIKRKYVTEMRGWVAYLITFFITFFINVFYIQSLSRKTKHNHLFYFLFQFIVAILLIYFALQLFSRFDYKADLTPMIIAIVLSFEIFWLYEWAALKMRKLFGYETFLSE
jgi:hypothetical protein